MGSNPIRPTNNTMNVTHLIYLVKGYARHRREQGPNWDKQFDCQAIFNEMIRLGIRGCSGTSGCFTGTVEGGKCFAIALNDEEDIVCGVGDGLGEILFG